MNMAEWNAICQLITARYKIQISWEAPRGTFFWGCYAHAMLMLLVAHFFQAKQALSTAEETLLQAQEAGPELGNLANQFMTRCRTATHTELIK